ncbi:nitrate ABC transporter substrate-binding protein [Enemella evansiae]|uniref:ABC transporter substrate-binding protein n=1 Tax=Enemella evansiae TaxID=2016499 RepID=UPI000B97421D|nr:ABC transporter substrate-binding protein [Enemella evansiae]OYO09897.1 nitrate ABC transporter substrate-binding protein [Enemella evansiae]
MSINRTAITRRTLLGSAVGLSTAALLAGCAKKGGAASVSDTGILNVGQISDSVAFFPLHVAEQQGFFEANGVKLGERPRLGTGAKLAAALKSGAIDLAAGVTTDAFNLYEVDKTARLTAGLVTEYYVDVVVGNDFAGPAEQAPLNDRVSALVGKKIGITGPGSGTEALLVHLFQQIGKDANKDATLVNLGAATTAAVGALKSKQVDALSFFQPIGQVAAGEGTGKIYISPQRGDVPSLAGVVHGCVFSTTAVLDAKKTMVDGFNKSMDQALQFIRQDKDTTRTLLKSYLQGTPDGVIDSLLALLPEEMSASHAISRAAYDKSKDFHMQTGLAKNPPDFATFVPQASQA